MPVACGIEVPSALITRFPGLDYVLQYLIKEGLQNNPLKVGNLISEFTASLLAETFNVAARLNSSAMFGGDDLNASQQMLDLAEAKLRDSNRHLREAALRYRRSAQAFPPQEQ